LILEADEIKNTRQFDRRMEDVADRLETMTTPNKILAMDLVNMEKFEVRGFKYLFNAIDMSSRFIYSVALKNKEKGEVLKGFMKIYSNTVNPKQKR
jgi:hypothetical protein